MNRGWIWAMFCCGKGPDNDREWERECEGSVGAAKDVESGGRTAPGDRLAGGGAVEAEEGPPEFPAAAGGGSEDGWVSRSAIKRC